MEAEVIKQIADFGVALSLPGLVCYFLYKENVKLKAQIDKLNLDMRDLLIKQIESENTKNATTRELTQTLSDFMINVAVKRIEDGLKEG